MGSENNHKKMIRGMENPSYVERLRVLEVFRLDIKKKKITRRVVEQASREAVDALSLQTLKVMLDRALSNLIWLKMLLFISGALDQIEGHFMGPFHGSFQPMIL